MKINQEKVKERMAGVPEKNRSHIYDASIVLEFLAATFMPTKFFLPDNFSPTPGTPLGAKSMRKVSIKKEMGIYDLYNLYLVYREEKDYTIKIESRYIFGIIVRNLRLYKNNWEFTVWRVGVAQIWHIGPLMMRKDVSSDDRAKFAAAVEDKTVEAVTVEADPVSEPEDDMVVGVDLAEEGSEDKGMVVVADVKDGFVEVTDVIEIQPEGLLGKVEDGQLGKDLDTNRFVEAKGDSRPNVYEPDEGIEQIAAEEY